ncbi:DUF2069 domain-containing protein [Alteromonas sp. C1M14]|uniref:DUF2069 domain-containing protein n=1 Tax=Alteromonas sp. C1M14 TaxID=2841567 RepID=UPI001C08D87F|nr:DUF2069 domain-containing protein [Alteromonas sp. C1M14]MBU2976787.1 DUF2069 domain-containing protein [Alteromonas sp. C1M14]
MMPKTRLYRWVALISYLLLLGWITVWQFVLVEARIYSTLFVALVYILPLVLPLRGLVAGKPYTHAWANFVILFYVIHGFTVAYAVPAERVYAIIELLLCTTMFTGCCVYARLRGRELGLGLKKLKQVMAEEKAAFEGKEENN